MLHIQELGAMVDDGKTRCTFEQLLQHSSVLVLLGTTWYTTQIKQSLTSLITTSATVWSDSAHNIYWHGLRIISNHELWQSRYSTVFCRMTLKFATGWICDLHNRIRTSLEF